MTIRRDVQAVGLHSLFLDGHEGTETERHVILTDLDSKRLKTEHQDFRLDLEKPMRRFGVTDFYLFETQKGFHGFSPTLLSRKDTERFEETLRYWGGDGIHSTMSWRNGGAVLRVTPKAGEGDPCDITVGDPYNEECPTCFGTGWTGPRFSRHFRVPFADRPDLPTWSSIHFDFLNDLHHHRLPTPLHHYTKRNVAGHALRFEYYTTTEAVPSSS